MRQLQQESCDLSLFFFFNEELFLECVFVLLPGVEDRSEFTSAVVIDVPLGKHVACPVIELLTPVTLFNLQSINYLVL